MKKNHPRGSALTEFVLLLFPYMLLLMAALFFWHLAFGKQELFDYAQAAATLGATQAHIATHFANDPKTKFGANTQYSATEEDAYNRKVGVRDAIDEPILPYSREDLDAALARESIRITATLDASGAVQTEIHATRAGQVLLDYDLLPGLQTGRISAGTNLQINPDTDITAAVAQALGTWLAYRGADGGNYRHTVQFGADQNLGIEKGTVPTWRSTTGVTVGGARAFGAYQATIENPDLRGDYRTPRLAQLDQELSGATQLNLSQAENTPSAATIPADAYKKFTTQQ